MLRLVALFSIVAALFAAEPVGAGPAEDAAALWARWEQVYNSGDADKFVALYTKDAMLFGSTPQLATGSDGVRTYYTKLPAGIQAKMGEQKAIEVAPNVLLISGFVDFILKNGTVLPFRLTLAAVKTGAQWLVAQHHGSPLPK
jgi:uncharacterized protein (TIGR02246 family)